MSNQTIEVEHEHHARALKEMLQAAQDEIILAKAKLHRVIDELNAEREKRAEAERALARFEDQAAPVVTTEGGAVATVHETEPTPKGGNQSAAAKH